MVDLNKAYADPFLQMGLSLMGNPNTGEAIQQGLGNAVTAKKQFDRERAGKAFLKALKAGATPQEILQVAGEYDLPLEDVSSVLKAMQATEAPSNVREYEYVNKLSPEEREKYLQVKRADQVLNLGGSQVVRSPGGGITESYPVTPKPEQMPEFQGQQEAAKVAGKNTAERQAQLPNALEQADYAISLLNQLEVHPGLQAMVGMPNPLGGAVPNPFGERAAIPGTNAADFKAILEQVQGKQFLEAFETLKGGGQITEVEGKKATQAIARMQTAQSEQAFLGALREFKDVVKRGRQRLMMQAKSPSRDIENTPPPGMDKVRLDESLDTGQPRRRVFNPATGRLE